MKTTFMLTIMMRLDMFEAEHVGKEQVEYTPLNISALSTQREGSIIAVFNGRLWGYNATRS
jgi:hypothetical protein